jgi:uncharacterized protein (UPF0548 family)
MSSDIRLGRPSPSWLEARLAVASAAPVSYDHVGSTLREDTGRSVHRETLELGASSAAFERAKDGLRAWVCHRGIGAFVHPGDAPIEVGSTLLVVLRVGPVSIVVPDRVVAVVDEGDRFGFAYGTLVGHQERGEELFLAERRADGTVQGTLTVDAVTATLAARAVSPAVEWFQHHAARQYLVAWSDFVQRGS